ncbi:Scn10a [Symbiodinium sp. CCMP2456]|nr:Scn10a [Symbiodinium sp. CCMP2456]
MILSCALAVIFGLQCASGYRHEMHVKPRNEASSNKSTQHGGASGDTEALTCVTAWDEFECEGFHYYPEDSFKYIADGKCCTQKKVACESGSNPYTCEGEHGEEKKKGWKFYRSKESNMRGKCCLITDSQVWLTCETGLNSFDCEGFHYFPDDSFKYIGDVSGGKCCTHKSLECVEGSNPYRCEGEHGENKKEGWKFIRSKESNMRGKCCLVPKDKGWFGWR